jgi:hypothetical protein
VKLTLAFIVILIAASAMAGMLYYSGMIVGPITLDQFVAYLGLLITVVAFSIGCYFAMIAVTGYAHVRDIERAASDANKLVQTLESTVEEAEKRGVLFTSYISQSSIIISEFISAVGSPEASEFVNRLHVIRRRFEFAYAKTDAEKIRAARDLITLGELNDWEMVKKFLQGRNEQDARELRLEVLKKIRGKGSR